jgi:hypothetical protein
MHRQETPTGNPSSVMKMGVDNGNSGITDITWFEVEVLKSLIGYTVGDIKFFALTMRDDTEPNYTVLNFFKLAVLLIMEALQSIII